MKKLLLLPSLFIVGGFYAQSGAPCYDISIGEGLPDSNGQLKNVIS